MNSFLCALKQLEGIRLHYLNAKKGKNCQIKFGVGPLYSTTKIFVCNYKNKMMKG